MQCMKCGREVPQGQVFCEDCLGEMDKYPVNPGTVVQLPRRPSVPPAKRAPQRRRPSPSPEEQIARLRKRIRLLTALLILAVFALMGLGYYVLREQLQEQPVFLPGQNYSSVTSTAAPADSEPAAD